MFRAHVWYVAFIAFLTACENSRIPTDQGTPRSTLLQADRTVAHVEDKFLTYPVGEVFGQGTTSIYHFTGLPIGTFSQDIHNGSFNWAAFHGVTQWRNDSLLQAQLVNWRYMRFTSNNGFAWQTSTSPTPDLRHVADTSSTLWPATDVVLNYKIVKVLYSPPSGSISGPTQISSNGTYTWTANAQGSSGSYAYRWDYSENAGATWIQLCGASLDSHCSRTVTTANPSFLLLVYITAYNGSTVPVTISVSIGSAPPPLTINLTGPTSVRSGSTCLWTATPTNGVAPYTYAWYVNSSSVNNNSSWPQELIYQNAGSNFTVSVQANDASGASGSMSKSVTISASAPQCAY